MYALLDRCLPRCIISCGDLQVLKWIEMLLPPPPLSGRDLQLNQTPPGWPRHPITATHSMEKCNFYSSCIFAVLPHSVSNRDRIGSSTTSMHSCICHGDNHQDSARPTCLCSWFRPVAEAGNKTQHGSVGWILERTICSGKAISAMTGLRARLFHTGSHFACLDADI